jgi:hypothetical protein
LIKKQFEEKGKIDFLLIIGNGLSDEEMFVAAKKNIKLNPDRFVSFLKKKKITKYFIPIVCV